MNSPIIVYLRNNVLITIGIILVGYFFYRYTPNLSIINLVERFTELSNNHNTSSAIIKLFSEKNNEIELFINLIKLSLTIILVLILFIFSFLYYNQKSFQEDINNLKDETNKNINELSSKILGIENVLTQHFDDYKIFTEYSGLQDSIIHHDFKQALKYDIDKITKLVKNDTYKSTVILDDNYLEAIDKIKLLNSYIDALIEQAQKGIIVKRLFIIKRELNDNEINHFKLLKLHNINVKTIYFDKMKEIKEPIGLNKNLSNNFIIINDKEVAFAYPFEDTFRFAVNIINNKNDRESTRYFNLYLKFFDDIYYEANEFKG